MLIFDWVQFLLINYFLQTIVSIINWKIIIIFFSSLKLGLKRLKMAWKEFNLFFYCQKSQKWIPLRSFTTSRIYNGCYLFSSRGGWMKIAKIRNQKSKCPSQKNVRRPFARQARLRWEIDKGRLADRKRWERLSIFLFIQAVEMLKLCWNRVTF